MLNRGNSWQRLWLLHIWQTTQQRETLKLAISVDLGTESEPCCNHRNKNTKVTVKILMTVTMGTIGIMHLIPEKPNWLSNWQLMEAEKTNKSTTGGYRCSFCLLKAAKYNQPFLHYNYPTASTIFTKVALYLRCVWYDHAPMYYYMYINIINC